MTTTFSARSQANLANAATPKFQPSFLEETECVENGTKKRLQTKYESNRRTGGMAVATPVCGGLRRHKPIRAPIVAAGVAPAGYGNNNIKSTREDIVALIE